MNTAQLHFMHYRSEDARGATLAILPSGDGKATVAISICGRNDVFCRKTGRQIATGRLQAFLAGRDSGKLKGKVFEIDIDPENVKLSVDAALGTDLAEEGFF